MKRYGILVSLWLVMAVATLGSAQAATYNQHYFNCKNCHKAGVSFTDMGSVKINVCLQCHVEGKGYITGYPLSNNPPPTLDGTTGSLRTVGDASNHWGKNPEAIKREISHSWGVPDTLAAAGAQAPVRTEFGGFYSRYNVSLGKVTCSRCHNPHGEAEVDEIINATGLPGSDGIWDSANANRKLMPRDSTSPTGTLPLESERVCRACHVPFNITNTAHATISHPIVANYDAFQSGKDATYRTSAEILANPAQSKVKLVPVVKGGTLGVGCTSCHGPHDVDSDSTTPDGPANRAGLAANWPGGRSDGHLLRSDGPGRLGATGGRDGLGVDGQINTVDDNPDNTSQLRSNLCQSCHKYKRHGKGGNQQLIGCLDCHGGHSYNGGAASAFALKNVTPDAVPVRLNRAANGTAPVTFPQITNTGNTRGVWSDGVYGTSTGYCEKCHGDVEDNVAANGVGRDTSQHLQAGWTYQCDYCHVHSESSYSFAVSGSAAVCGDCHGFPPYLSVAGNRNTGGTDGGYAYVSAAHNYQAAAGYKAEAATPHNTHAAGGTLQGAATDYMFATGTASCDPCHLDIAASANHNVASNPGSYRDMAWSTLATGNGVMSGGSAPNYNTSTWVCTNIYCHSNGGKRNVTGTRVIGDFVRATTPSWNNGDATIVGQTTPTHQCNFCHGNTASTMASGQKNNSASHQKHLGTGTFAKTYSCKACHSQTAATNTALQTGARLVNSGGKHVNGSVEVVFDTTYNLGAGLLTSTQQYNGGALGTCTAVYCHSNGKGSYYAADWDTAASGACGTCHQYYSGTTPTGAGAALSAPHAKHLAITLPSAVTCVDCHGTNATAGTHTGHVDGAFTIVANACNGCHGWEAGETVPAWGQPMDNNYCIGCHAGSVSGTVKTKGAPNKESAKTRGHNRPTASGAYPVTSNPAANKLCTDCHETTITNHIDGTTGNATGLKASAATCTTSCHGAGGSAARNGINSHMGKACVACHNVHGSDNVNNIQMIHSSQTAQNTKDTSGTGEYGGTVTFSAFSGDNSFDEDDGTAGSAGEANSDDLCATCHTAAAGTSHNNRDNTDSQAPTGHHMGEDCFTSCHAPHTDATNAFKSGGGNACDSCHDFPPNTGAHGDGSNKHARTATNLLTEDRSDCAWCHTGADQYTYDTGADQAAGGARGNHNKGDANQKNVLTASVGYNQTNFSCANACHLSSAADGAWNDANGLNCNACHYYEATVTGSANNIAAGTKALQGSHNAHFAKNKQCAACHDVPVNTTHISIPTGTDIQKIQSRAAALQDEADVKATTYGSGSDPDPGNPTCAGAGVALGCHNTKTTPAWNTTGITCTNCHDPAGSATADPKSGLHNMTQAGVQKHDSTISGGCAACHNSTKPATHANGTWQADQANNTESRFLNRSGLVYNDAGGPNMGSCFDNGASGAGSLDFAVSCHRDNGVWKRLWTTEADSTATVPGSARCKACHGQYSNLNGNQGGGWNENTSHYLTYGGRNSVRGETHNSRTLGDASACEDCHSFPSLSNHENGSLTMNDAPAAGDTDVNDTTTQVYCAACHVAGDPLVAGTFTLTKSTAFAKAGVDGSYHPISQCNSCHGVGGSGRYWPVAPNGDANARNHAGRHEIHMMRLATKVYGETVAQLLTNNTAQNPALTSDTKQKNLCEYCHTAPAGFSGHHNETLPVEVVIANLWNKAADAGATYSSNQHGAGGNDTCAGVNCHNNKLTVDNSYGWYDATTGAGCVVCHTVGGANDLPNNNIHPNTGLHNVTPTVSGVKHDDSFSVSGTCNSCHTGIVSTMVGGTHINGAAVADGASNNDRGLFAAYTDAVANTGTCFGTGVDNTTNCHADGGTWKRRWSTTASANDGATECANCHGTFTTGWRWDNPAPAGTTDHSDPSALNTGGAGGDAMGFAGMHPDCQICHGWGKAGYLTAWQNKTAGATPGHGDGRITMNGPSPSTGAGYNASTWGCAAACHSATWVMSDSGLTPNYGDYGGGSCDGCHGVTGTGQYWPNGSGGTPTYVDDNANSASRHDTHLATIAQYKWGMTLTQLKANDANQKAACAFCHPNPGAGGHNSDSGDQRVDVAGAGAFRKFIGSNNDAVDAGSGAYASASRSCSNLVCHNLVTTPIVAADAWEGTTAANCTTLCHGPNTVATAREGHQKHVVTKGYACTQCHPNNGTNYQHINGTVTLNFLVTGSLEQTYGSGTVAAYSDGSFTFDRTTPTGTCTNVYCHVDKQTPAWNGTINTSTTGCIDCHTVGGAGNNPTSGLHDVTPQITSKQHSSSFTYNSGASTAYCSTCHTAQPTVLASDHVNGVFSSTPAAAGNTIINFAAGVGYTDGTTPTCGATITGCHKDAGAWQRKWHENSTASNGNECAGCHGDWLRTWNTGVTHRTDSGPTNSHPTGTNYKCKDCHALESSAYSSLTWGGNHGNGQITMNSNATSFARGTGGDAGLSGCAAGCHNAFDGTAAGQHSFTSTTSRWATVQLLSGDIIDAGCNGCHGNTTVGVGQYWPDGTVNKAQYAYADDNATAAANHTAHIAAIAKKRYNEELTASTTDGLLRDNTTNNPTLKSSDKQKAICAYCHPSPGGSGHSTDAAPTSRVDVNNTDSDNNSEPDVNVTYKFKKIIGGVDDNSAPYGGYFRATSTDKTCSNIACHANAPYTPGWYGDTVPPGNVSTLLATPNGSRTKPEPGTVELTWTAVGDDNGVDGTAHRYDLRYRLASDGTISSGNFASSPEARVPTVDRGSKLQKVIINGLTPGQNYTFALKTYDEAGNVSSSISNVASGTAQADNLAPSFWGINAVSANDYSLDLTPTPDTNSVNVSWDAASDHSHSLTTPLDYLVLWSEYSLRTHFSKNGAMPASIGTDACFNKSTTPPTLITCGTGGTNEYRIKSAQTTALNYDVPNLPVGVVYNFLVRAKDQSGNIDSNRAELMAMARSTAYQAITLQTLKTSATIPTASTGWTGLPGGSTSASDAALGASYPGTAPTTFSLAQNAVVVWSPTTTYAAKTNVWGVSYQIQVTGNTTGATTLTYQFGYVNASKAFTALGTAKTLTISRRAPLRVIKFPLSSFKGAVPAGSKPAFVLKNTTLSAYAVTLTYGSDARKGGILLFNEQPSNDLPTGLASLSQSQVTSTFVGGRVFRLTWNAADPVNAGQTVHYDVFASLNGGSTYPYVVGRNLTTNSVDWDPVGDGITGNQTNVVFKVLAGDGYREGDMIINSSNANNENHSVAVSSPFTVDNTVDVWAPAAIGSAAGTADDLKAETRPKQGSVYLSWKAVGNDGFNHGTRATVYDIRYSTATINDSNWSSASTLTNEPFPNFTGSIEGYEAFVPNPESTYYFAMKVGDVAGNWSVLSNVASAQSGGKCGICHSTPPDETATAGKHAVHGYTMNDCANCHGNDPVLGAQNFKTDHQDGDLKVGWKTTDPKKGLQDVTRLYYTIDGTAGGTVIYDDNGINDSNPAGGGGFVNTGGDQTDNGRCFNFNAAGATGCHGPATPDWATATPALACSACHGTGSRTTDPYAREFDATLDNNSVVPDQIKAAPPLDNHGNSTGKYTGAHLKHLNSSFRLAKGDNCKLCHNNSIHADGTVDVAYDYNVTGLSAQWDTVTLGPNGGGTCGGTSVDNCHGNNVTPPEWHTAATVDCVQCHGFSGTTPSHVTDPAGGYSTAGTGNCTRCHPSGHPQGTVQDPNSIMIPNNPLVGIAYRSGGIHLLKTINSRGPYTTEAEVCWACHNAQTPKISEWGTNTDAATGNSTYNYGGLFTDINFGTATLNWIGVGTGAYWQSGTTAFQTVKKGKIQSTHSTNAGGTSAVTYDATNRRYNETLDAVADIRCSNCHDVHNMNKAPGDGPPLSPNGTPYLRGSWKGNPYAEDGPPLTGTTYTAQRPNTALTYGYGAVPRGGTLYTQTGGYYIDQNNVIPGTSTAASYPTTGWTLENSAGLCSLCHLDVDGMDQTSGENLWMVTNYNGHSNSAIGGTFTQSSNIFDQGTSSISGRPAYVATQSGTTDKTTQVPDMGYMSQGGTYVRGYGYRGADSTNYNGSYTPSTDPAAKGYSYMQYDWGATVDAGATDTMYHQFSCSKCHNPHASRLPKLLISNCLDVQHNTWDDDKSSQAAYTAATNNDLNKKSAYYNSAQNCHRYQDFAGRTATTISFTAPNLIGDSGSGFTAANGFRLGARIRVAGSAANSRIYTILALANNQITVAEGGITTAAAGTSITVRPSWGGWNLVSPWTTANQ